MIPPAPELRSRLRQLNAVLIGAGLDGRRIARTVIAAPTFVGSWAAYRRACVDAGIRPPHLRDVMPLLADAHDEGGEARGHYFHQDLWAARKIYKAAPFTHVDIGSRIDGFIAHLLTFRSVTVVDIRPLSSSVPGLEFVHADATTLASFADQSVPSISSLHAVEHIGLGRYGDPVDPLGWRAAIESMQRIAAGGARIYFAVPIGRERTMFNGQRIFDPLAVVDAFSDCELVEFAGVDDAGDLVQRASPSDFRDQGNACGLFEFEKLS